MSVFKRAEWHSGLTYRQTCETCKSIVEYTDDKLDFRPWYADGFVYCPVCNTPLRHRETYAIDGDNKPTVVSVETASTQDGKKAAFCSKCGNKFDDGDRFCSNCGKKR